LGNDRGMKIFNLTLSKVLAQIDCKKIIQIHRSWACNVDAIFRVRAKVIELDNRGDEFEIGIGDSFRENLP